jgi:murein DD-endopeptidase MepM/ murein hydrolase activator NlpD
VARRRLLGLALVCAAVLTAPSALADLAEDKQQIDSRIAELRDRIAEAKEREGTLTSDISAASEQIDAVQTRVDDLDAEVTALEAELARQRARLAELRELLAQQTRVLAVVEANEREANERLENRVVSIYTNRRPGTIDVLLSVSSLDDLVSGLEYLQDIADRDREIAAEVADARVKLAAERRRTQELRDEQARITAALAERTAERQAALDELVARRDELVSAQADRRSLLDKLRGERHDAQEDVRELERASAELADRIRSAQGSGSASTGSGAAPASGFIWPVEGPITSPFGYRWGRMHEGIDIGVGFGTPIRAAASGTVIYAGWLGGYGNLVVVDHGGGLSTAYGHQQRIYVAYGQQVGQGEVLGEVGSTGHSFGPHLHFEVRVNGSPVDPLGYL